MASIKDGTSNTYLVGEKYLNPDKYETGSAAADDQCLYQGHDRDNARSTHIDSPPRQDQRGTDLDWTFGSAHPGRLNMSFCDGSVRMISYSIARELHRDFGNRADGNAVSLP